VCSHNQCPGPLPSPLNHAATELQKHILPDRKSTLPSLTSVSLPLKSVCLRRVFNPHVYAGGDQRKLCPRNHGPTVEEDKGSDHTRDTTHLALSLVSLTTPLTLGHSLTTPFTPSSLPHPSLKRGHSPHPLLPQAYHTPHSSEVSLTTPLTRAIGLMFAYNSAYGPSITWVIVCADSSTRARGVK
jgi:hypothetical protein